jgi:CubicO group peptidase (beta-lactamase class C family)
MSTFLRASSALISLYSEHKVTVAIGLFAIMGGLGDFANARTPSVSDVEQKRIEIERVVQSEMASRGIPGLQLTIVRHNKIVFTGVYGQANMETKIPVTQQTVFGINSISKAFVGVAAMQLVEAGKLDVEAPLAKYLGELPVSWRSITVRQTLTHMSGLPEIVDDNLRLIDGAESDVAWAKVQELPLDFPPGEQFDYTQTNYVLLGKIIEKITGESFSDFVRERQFDKVRMKRTSFAETAGVAANANPQAAQLYTYLTLLTKGTKTIGVERSKVPLARIEPWKEFSLPAGGVQTTSTDLAKWVIALHKLKLLKKNSLERLWKPEPQKDGSYRGFTATINGYGLGWPSIRRSAHPAITPIGGERAAIFIYPEDHLTVIVLTNLLGASPQKFVDKIASIYLPHPIVEH